MVEPLLVPDNLNGDWLPRLVVETLDYLTERSLPYYLSYLIAIGDVVMENFDIATIFIIIALSRRERERLSHTHTHTHTHTHIQTVQHITHSIPHSHKHLPKHSVTHSHTHTTPHPNTQSHTHTLTQPSPNTQSLTHTLTHSLTTVLGGPDLCLNLL